MRSFDFWEQDKFDLEYMLDHCIIAKMIEQTGHKVPDRYRIYYDGHYEMVDCSTYFDSVEQFLQLAHIGVLKYRDLDRDEYLVDLSIRLYALEELAFLRLSEKQKKKRDEWIYLLKDGIDYLDAGTIEGVCNVVGNCIFIRCEYAYGRASEFCEKLLTLHNRAKKMIHEIKTNSKGEKSDACHSAV